MFVIVVAIVIILPVDVTASNATTNATTSTPSPNNTNLTTTAGPNVTNTTTTPSTNVTVNVTDATENNATVTTITNATTGAENVTQTTQVATTESDPTTPTIPPTTATDSTRTLLVTDIVQQNWSSILAATNFSGTVLANSNVSATSSSDFLDTVVEYYTTTNQTQLQAFLQENRIDVVASAILENDTAALDEATRALFNASGTSSLLGFFAFMHWMNDFVLTENSERFSSLLGSYNSDMGDSNNATINDFLKYIMSNSNGSEIFDAVCNIATSKGVAGSQCSPTTPPEENRVERFNDRWKDVLAHNFTSLDDEKKQELESITADNMTDSLVTYVLNMPEEEIQKLLDVNATAYVSALLRKSTSALTEILGQEIVTQLGNNETKQDVYFLYLNFLNGLASTSGNFAEILDEYVISQNQTSNQRSAGCNRSSINPDGLTCHIITVYAQNTTYLAIKVCSEFDDSSACEKTFITDDEPVTEPTPTSGLSLAIIIGAAVGGFVGLLLLAGASYLIYRRCTNKKSKVNPQNDRVSPNENNDAGIHAERIRLQGNGRGPNTDHRDSDGS